MAHLGNKLKNYRVKFDLTQAEMAKNLSIGYRTYQTIESTGEVKKIEDMNSINTLFSANTQFFADMDAEGDVSVRELLARQIKAFDRQSQLMEAILQLMTRQDNRANEIQASLVDIRSGQKDIQSQLVASVRRSAERFVADDQKKMKKELDMISKYAGQVRMNLEAAGAARGNPAPEDSQESKVVP